MKNQPSSFAYSSPAQKSENENSSTTTQPWYQNLKYLLVGIFFGIVFVKSEVVSWFRIQEMFRLESFHMYGIISSAILVALLSIQVIKRLGIRTLGGEPIAIADKRFHKGQIYGGLLFGLGWAMTGACPGPLFAQIGTGALAVVVTLLSAVFGTWFYGFIREKLPH
ncbi:DUF6691 family protein [Planobacterium oryzisoli]|uniref:YeeE/YedE family protein n=1 Tax=Planobacterium oryzisoli TaxID=2771435 RepID=A0A930YVC8_9FLAO|nr:DUF6691 family protein [Planobacterium oryzisoli]MBF5027040.1 YeeE/YedE family protein [Planobacterium oryzisoli]